MLTTSTVGKVNWIVDDGILHTYCYIDECLCRIAYRKGFLALAILEGVLPSEIDPKALLELNMKLHGMGHSAGIEKDKLVIMRSSSLDKPSEKAVLDIATVATIIIMKAHGKDHVPSINWKQKKKARKELN